MGDLVELLDRYEDVVLGGYRRLDVITGDDTQVVQSENVLRIGHGDHELVIDDGHGHEDVSSSQVLGNDGYGVGLGLAHLEIDVLDSDLTGHDREDGPLCGVAEVNENTTKRTPRRLVNLQGIAELSIRDNARPHEELAKSLYSFRQS